MFVEQTYTEMSTAQVMYYSIIHSVIQPSKIQSNILATELTAVWAAVADADASPILTDCFSFDFGCSCCWSEGIKQLNNKHLQPWQSFSAEKKMFCFVFFLQD